MATGCGYSYAQIDEMTLDDYDEICEYWIQHPPAHLLIAGYIGYKAPPRIPKDATSKEPVTADSRETELAAFFNAMTGSRMNV